jgi:hypothetical protein
MRLLRGLVVVALCWLSLPLAHAQWVMVARAVSGRVQRMQQQRTANNGGYDVATVILEAKADKVYETALNSLKAHSSEVTITSTDDKKQKINFTNGQQNASLQATSLGPTVTQLVIASNAVENGQTGTSIVLQGVLRVCKEMNVTCRVEE